MKDGLIATRDSCIAIGCRSDAEGDTEFTLGRLRDVDPGADPILHGRLKTPTYRIALRSVLGRTILEAPVQHRITTIRVWVNDSEEPDSVIVGIE
jgi:hypothetical protein